jgi:catechol 2,3-dioxygenase-like lactoylglutathione lyase family enzyme
VATARYLVSDVEQCITFYTEQLGFELTESMSPAFAIVRHGDLSLWLSGPKSSAARAMPDGARPEPGGWNRVVVQVDDLVARVSAMQAAGVRFRNAIVSGPGGKQILVEDPSGNVVELFQPA